MEKVKLINRKRRFIARLIAAGLWDKIESVDFANPLIKNIYKYSNTIKHCR